MMACLRRLRFILAGLLVVGGALAVPALHAQFASGVEATVADSTGAVIQGADRVPNSR
jgi:hypothetical protein